MTPNSHDVFAAFVGIDWADAKHDGCLQAAGSATRECFQLEHTPEAIDAWVSMLRTRFNGRNNRLTFLYNFAEQMMCTLPASRKRFTIDMSQT